MDVLEQRLKTKIWVQSYLRRTEADGFSATLVRRGDADAGAVLIKVNRLCNGCSVYTQVRDENGDPAWFSGTGKDAVSEDVAEAYIARQKQYDADLWVVEVEDPKSAYWLDGKILES
ncbi:MAG: DUF1491 family protein [Rhodospirillaceae bacterium]